MKNILHILRHPRLVGKAILERVAPYLSDVEYIRLSFRVNIGHWPDLHHPQTFNEKLQWLKLHDHRPEYTMLVDKVEVKRYVAERLGEQYLIPTLGVWDDPDDIDFDRLPQQFVLKCNHNSGLGACICKDKSKLNFKQVRESLRRGLQQDYYLFGREWPYKNVKRRILAERFMQNAGTSDLDDYKLMCFNGEVHFIFVCSERYAPSGLKVTFFNKRWEPMPFTRHYPASSVPIPRPQTLDEMIRLAEKLSVGIPFVRCDFYEINGKVYFGEMTFFPGSGFEEFTPEIWDLKLGSLISLPVLTSK